MKKRSRFTGIFFGILILLLTATMGFGATWYVATDGDDGGTGTQSAPYETIQHAVSSADNGDTVMVEAGTYSGNINIIEDRLVLKSLSGADTTTIRGGTYGIDLTGDGLTVEGFTIESNDYGILVSSVQTEDLTLSSNKIQDFVSEGIYLELDIAGCSVTIQDNEITGGTYGIDLDGDMGTNDEAVTVRITNNMVTGCSETGIYFDDLYSGTVEISKNTLLDCTENGIYIDETGHNGIEMSFKVQDNTITLSEGENGTYGIYIWSPERTTWVTGNTISGDYDEGIYADYVGYYGYDPVLFYVENNHVTGANYGIYLEQVFYEFGGSVYVRNNTISEADDYGVYVQYLGYNTADEDFTFTFTFEDNLISDCEYGLDLESLFYNAAGTASIRHNSFGNNDMGLYIESIYNFEDSTLTIEDNNFVGNDDHGLNNNTEELVDATNNWWGDETGPYDGRIDPTTPDYNNVDGLGDEVSDNVDYADWRETPYTGGSDSSSSGCAVGGFSPAMLLLALPLAGLFRRK